MHLKKTRRIFGSITRNAHGSIKYVGLRTVVIVVQQTVISSKTNDEEKKSHEPTICALRVTSQFELTFDTPDYPILWYSSVRINL